MSGKEGASLTEGEIRREIDRVFKASTGADDVLKIAGISLIARREERNEGEDCVEYVFPGDNLSSMELVLNSKPLEKSIPGAIAFYFEQETGEAAPVHVGIVLEDGNVASKWNIEGHVYKHPPNLVPFSFGTFIRYYNPLSSKSTQLRDT